MPGGSIVAVGSVVNSGSGTLSIPIPTLPGGGAHDATHLLVVYGYKRSASSASPGVSSSGWTVDVDIPDTSATTHNFIASKQGGGGDTDVNITQAGAGTFEWQVLIIAGIDNVANPATRLVGIFGTGSGSGTLSFTVGPVTSGTPKAGDVAVSSLALANTTTGVSIDSGVLQSSSNSGGLATKVLTDGTEEIVYDWDDSRTARGAMAVYLAKTDAPGTGKTAATTTARTTSTKTSPGTGRTPATATARSSAGRQTSGAGHQPATTVASGAPGSKNVTNALTGAAHTGGFNAGSKATGGQGTVPAIITSLLAGAKDGATDLAGQALALFATVGQALGIRGAQSRSQADAATTGHPTAAKGAAAHSVAQSTSFGTTPGNRQTSGTGVTPTTASPAATGARGALGTTTTPAVAVAHSPGSKGANGQTAASTVASALATGARGALAAGRAVFGWWARAIGGPPVGGGCIHLDVTTPTITITSITSPTIAPCASTPVITPTVQEC